VGINTTSVGVKMRESGSVKVRQIHTRINQIEALSKKWSRKEARELLEEIKDCISVLKTNKQQAVKKGLKSLAATLSGTIAGRKANLIDKSQAKSYLKKLIPSVASLQVEIEKLDLFKAPAEVDEPSKQKTITIRPGLDSVTQEAQMRIQASMTDEDGLLRKAERDPEEEIPVDEQLWEEAEYHRITKEQNLQEWNQNFYGEIDEAFTKYHDQVANLKKVIKARAMLQIAPVVPTAKAESIFRVETLAQNGVKVVSIAGCALFENQLILTVNSKEVADKYSEWLKYQVAVKAYRKRLGVYTNKFYVVTTLEKEIKEFQEEIEWVAKIQVSYAVGKSVNVVEEMRSQRVVRLKAAIESNRAKIEIRKEGLKAQYAEYDLLMEEYRAFTKEGRSRFKGKEADYLTASTKLAEDCLAAINAKLEPEDQLVFVTPKGIAHGYVSCYWVMKDSQFGPWSGAICFSKLKLQILGWCFPRKSKPTEVSSFEREVETHQDLINLIHGLVEKEASWGSAEKSIMKFLDARRIKYEREVKHSVKKIWDEAPELLSEALLLAEIASGSLEENKVSIRLATPLKDPGLLRKFKFKR
jgi:hypothetical protein